jgi:hypothetical protein
MKIHKWQQLRSGLPLTSRCYLVEIVIISVATIFTGNKGGQGSSLL